MDNLSWLMKKLDTPADQFQSQSLVLLKWVFLDLSL